MGWPVLTAAIMILAGGFAAAAPAADQADGTGPVLQKVEYRLLPVAGPEGDPWQQEGPAPVVVENRGLYPASHQVHWFRLEIRVPDGTQEVILHNDFPTWHMTVHSPLPGGARHGGAARGIREFAYPFPAFRLPVRPGLNTVLVAVASPPPSPLVLRLHVSRPDDFTSKNLHRNLYLGLVLGAMLAIFIYNILILISQRSREHLYYILFLGTFIPFHLVLTGACSYFPGGSFIFRNWLTWDALSLAAVGFFVLEFLRIRRTSSPRLFYGVASFGVVALAVILLQQYLSHTALLLWLALSVLLLVGLTFAIGRSMLAGSLPSLYLFLSVVPGVGTGCILTLSVLGALPDTFNWESLHPVSAVIQCLLQSCAVGSRVRGEQQGMRTYLDSMKGFVPPHMRSQLLQMRTDATGPNDLDLTIMFIDIEGYSISSRHLTPRVVFDNLQKNLEYIRESVYHYGGIIDKTLGDGMLCFFGFQAAGEAGDENHARQALQCAVAIQKRSVELMMRAATGPEDPAPGLVYPLRIGIASGRVYVGNIGNQEIFDFTVSGDPVVFASRLESVCDSYRIMVAPSTRERLPPGLPESDALNPIHVLVKHARDFQHAWEYDPFAARPEAIDAARRIYWDKQRLQPAHPRETPVSPPLLLECRFGPLEVLDFSHGGFRFMAGFYLARGSRLFISLPDTGGDSPPGPFEVAIIRSSARGRRFEHGVKISGQPPGSLQAIFRWFQDRRGAVRTA